MIEAEQVEQEYNGYKFTDTGNAERLIDTYGQHLRYVAQMGWLVWDGKRWKQDETGRVMEFAKKTVRAMYVEAADIEDKYKKANLLAHALRSERAERLRAMVSLAQSDDRVAATVEDFDKDKWLFNVQNGTVDLRTGELRDHNPKDLITHVAAVPYESEADRALWERFISQITRGDTELADYLQRAIGYSLTGDVSEKGFFLCYGASGNNGKSTLLEAVLYAVGDYGQSMRPETIMVGGNKSSVPNDIAALVGARYVITSEPEDGARLNMGLIKRLTGSDTVQARFMRKEFFEFRPQLKMWVATNERPEVKDGGDAAWDRIKAVPFDAQFKGDQKDPRMPEKLREAAPAILAWAVEGCLAWQLEEGLHEPEAVKGAIQDYRDDQDPIHRFVQERCESDPEQRVETTTLYNSYTAWIQGEAEEKVGNREFYKALEKQGYPKKKTNGKWWINGLSLAPQAITSPAHLRAIHQPSDDEDDEFAIPF